MKNTRESCKQCGFHFVSPNVLENTTFDYAQKMLKSNGQAWFRSVTDDIDAQLGLKGESYSGIGDWADGAENTIYKELACPAVGGIDYESIRYSAAWKGILGNQKQVIPFVVGAGSNFLYVFKASRKDVRSIRVRLTRSNIQFRTLIPVRGGIRIVIFDTNGDLKGIAAGLAKHYKASLQIYQGRGEYLGADTRPQALREYKRVIVDYENGHNRKRWIPNYRFAERVARLAGGFYKFSGSTSAVHDSVR
ncbi:MAG: hypothetical protein HY602_01230 [Parcubacteria group bacterium]|nr:hypothetical protein [Parcubacteria group bacterium]